MQGEHIIDFRAELGRITPFLDGSRAGVASVRAYDGAPASVFAKAARILMRDKLWPLPWVSVQIEPTNSNTHYLGDIVRQIVRTCEIELPTVHPPVVSIAEGATADAITVENVNVSLEPQPFERELATDRRLRDVRNALTERLEDRRLALVFLNTHKNSPATLRELTRDLWNLVIAPLIDAGSLFVLDISDPRRIRGNNQWPPRVDSAFDLPAHLSAEAKSHAVEDIADVARTTGLYLTEAEASAFATGIVAPSLDIAALYANVARALVDSQAK